IDAGLGHIRDQEIENVAAILLCQRAYLLACSGDNAAAAAVLRDLTGGQGVEFSGTLHSWRQREAFVEAWCMQRTPESLPLLDNVIQVARETGNKRSAVPPRCLRMA